MHGKEIADRLGMKAPSAYFHLNKLERIRAVKLSYTQVINGIAARYYVAAVDDIVSGDDFLEPSDNKTIREKLIFTAHTFDTANNAFMETLQKRLRNKAPAPCSTDMMLLINEVLYLSQEGAADFSKDLSALLAKYSKTESEKKPFALFFSLSEMT